MVPAFAVTPLLLSLAAAPAAAATAEEFMAGLQAPVSLAGLVVDAADDELVIRFALREVGQISVVVRAEDDGSGRGIVTVGGTVVAEVVFVGDAVARKESDFSSLTPEQAQAVAASLVQVWHEDAVTAALERWSLKCTWAGGIAGATIGVAVFAGCGLISKNPGCYGHGWAVHSIVAGYTTDKCNGAQNK